LGLESERLRTALVNEEYRESVLSDEREAEQLGIHAVPAFIVNRRAALSGVQPVENLEALIERGRGFE
jgi:protein disulfide-isomerase